MRLLEDCQQFAERYRGRYVTSGPHWPLIIRFVKLFDYDLCQIYGYQTMSELMERQVVTGRAVMGSVFRLMPEGEKLVYWGFRVETEK